MLDLQNKTAVITGGGSGIGRSISELFASKGANVIILENKPENGDEVVKSITEAGGSARCIECDVADQITVLKEFDKLMMEFDSIDILVNNAGIAHIGAVENTAEEDFDMVYAVNVKGAYNCIKAVIHNMKANKSGVILNMSSVAAMVGIKDRFAYSMSKGAVLTMTYSVAKDYLYYNIRCNSIAPARVHTPFVDGFLANNYPGQEKEMFDKLSASQPIGRMGKPEEVAKLALFLCSDDASFITGCNYPIDGGFVYLNN